MKEIKFRVWSAKDGWFFDSYYPDVEIKYGELRVVNTGFYDSFIVEQFTGLMDKNGKEIYEGDIVKLADLNYKVFWDEWKWNASCPYYHQRHYPQFGDRFFSNARCSEVIGNIHENADLLK